MPPNTAYLLLDDHPANTIPYTLIDVIARINKTAIVVESTAQTDMAETFTNIAKDLPQTFKVFSSLAEAEECVKQ